MFHGPAAKVGKDPATPYKTRLGVWMFILYSLIYAVFVAISVTDVSILEAQGVLGMNLAVVFGFGLIIVALVLAVIYNHMCTKKEHELNALESDEGNAQ
jgi:uncharacterized membrane protein (DUF485 family)